MRHLFALEHQGHLLRDLKVLEREDPLTPGESSVLDKDREGCEEAEQGDHKVAGVICGHVSQLSVAQSVRYGANVTDQQQASDFLHELEVRTSDRRYDEPCIDGYQEPAENVKRNVLPLLCSCHFLIN